MTANSADHDLDARADRKFRQEIRAIDRRDAKDARRRQRIRQQGRPEIWRAASAALTCLHNNQKNETPDVLQRIRKPDRAAHDRDPHRGKMPRSLQKYLALDDFEPVARRRIPKSSTATSPAAPRPTQPCVTTARLRRIRFCAARAQRRLGRARPPHCSARPMPRRSAFRRWALRLAAYRGDIVLTKAARTENVPIILSASSLITQAEDLGGIRPRPNVLGRRPRQKEPVNFL